MKNHSKNKKILLILAVSLVIAVAGSTSANQVILYPDGEGDLTELTPKPVGSVNWVNMTTDDGDATFIEMASTLNWRTDLYSLGNPAVSGTINSVTVYVKARSREVGGQTGLRTAVQTEGTIYYGNEETLAGTYATYCTTYMANPGTADAWTWDEIDALQAGVSLRRSTVPPTTPWSRATQVWVVVDYTPTVIVAASVDIDPDRLNLSSKGEPVTCYIQLPEGYDVADIDVSSILLDDEISVALNPGTGLLWYDLQDSDGDGIDDTLMVKFDRQEVIDYIKTLITPPADVTLTVMGELTDETQFEGSDTIGVIDEPGGN